MKNNMYIHLNKDIDYYNGTQGKMKYLFTTRYHKILKSYKVKEND